MRKLLLPLILLGACTGAVREYSITRISVPAYTDLREQDLRAVLPPAPHTQGNSVLEIIVTSYSSGIEVYTCEDGEEVTMTEKNGCMKVMVKIRKGASLDAIRFIEACGPDRAAILAEFAVKFREALD